jgi:hypothetical protein
MALPREVFGKRAELTLGEAFGGDIVDTIETGTRIFPGDDGRKFDQLAFGELLAERRIEFIGDVGRNPGEHGGEFQDSLFACVKMRTGFESRQILKLLLSDPVFSAHGRVDVNSKRTPDH